MIKKDLQILFDIGGTYVRAYLVNGHKIVKSIIIKRPNSLTSFKKSLFKLFNKLSATRQVSLVDIGVAGRVRGTKVVSCSNIRFLKNFDFKILWPEAKFKLIVDNDARWQLRWFLRTKPDLSRSKVLLITLGTGVGRAVAISGQVKQIKKLEYRELWEEQYKLRRYDKTSDFVKWLEPKLFELIKTYKPEVVILAGGVVQKKQGFKDELRKLNCLQDIKVAIFVN